MTAGGPESRGALHHLHEDAVRTIAQEIATRREALAHQMVHRFGTNIGDGEPAPEEGRLLEEQVAFSLDNIDAFVRCLQTGEPPTAEWVARVRETAARRVHQRVSLVFFLNAARTWGDVLWETVVASARIDRPGEREAVIEIASTLMRQVDLLSRLAMNAYLDEITDRGLLRRDLLDALISGRGDTEDVQRQAASLHLRLGKQYIVIAVRGADMHGEVGRDEPLSSRVALDRIVETTRSQVRPSAGSLLAGVRDGDLVVLYPVAGPCDMEDVRLACARLAEALTVEVSIGMSACHTGLAAIGTAYAEARDAVALAHRLGIRGRAVALDDVLVDHMLRASAHAQRILAATLAPLRDYDQEHGTAMLATLQAYIAAHFNLTKSAKVLSVHPNTVVYRLRRIRELTGRDPQVVDDLIVLSLALKADGLRATLDP